MATSNSYTSREEAQDILNLASEYSSSATYAVGDYVRYDSKLYKCISAITTAEEWNDEHWEEIENALQETAKLSRKCGDFSNAGHGSICTSIESIESQLDGVETLLASI